MALSFIPSVGGKPGIQKALLFADERLAIDGQAGISHQG